MVEPDRNQNPNLLDEVKRYLKTNSSEEVYAQHIHRLDRPVRGLVLFAKKRNVLKNLSEQFAERRVKKFYRALTANAPEQRQGRMEHWHRKEKKKAVLYDHEIEYSEKAVAIVGEGTKKIKDELKKIGAKFNFRLSCGAGWIYPKSRINELTDLLSSLSQQQPTQEGNTQEQPIEAETEAQAPQMLLIEAPKEEEITHPDPMHPINICDPQSTRQIAEVQEVKIYDNLEDINSAVRRGDIISLCNLSNIVNNKTASHV